MEPDRSPVRSQRLRRREALREIREELERVRRSEARIAEALGSLRAARHRVEELVRGIAVEDDAVRNLVREEVAAAVDDRDTAHDDPAVRPPAGGGVRGLFAFHESEGGDSTGDTTTESADEESEDDLFQGDSRRAALRMVGTVTASVLVLASVAWLGVRALRDAPDGPSITLGGDTSPVAAEEVGGAPVSGEPGGGARPSEQSGRFFSALPAAARERAHVYDSIWRARSPLFDPLLGQLEDATSERSVRSAIEAWRAGNLTPLQGDLLHSALVQLALEQQIGADLTVDGQVLRNPCRGASCTALLNFWETRAGSVGLPPVPENAPTDLAALRVAESVLVLKALERASGGTPESGR
jgi:hypothetical protein